MNEAEKWRGVADRDRSLDGRFLYGVRSTGIFCRPSCASRRPRRENVVFFDTPEEALGKGYRPCKRCHPELPAYDPAAELAAQARAIIDQRFAEPRALRARLNALGVTRRHLTEVFEGQYGLSPEQYAAQARFDRARELLLAGSRVTDAAFAVGMESTASFSTFFKKQAGVAPSEYVALQAEEHPWRIIDTPLGAMRVEEDRRGIASLRFVDGREDTSGAGRGGLYLDSAEAQLAEYFAGKRRSFDLPLSLSGTDFQTRVWNALREIPYGETRSYQQVAAAIGRPGAARAVGAANNRNPVLILVPCHRVVGKSGAPVGYAGGIERKRLLLELEAAR